MRWSIVLLALLLVLPLTLAEQVVINSDDWRDVYTGLQYAAINGYEASFIIDEDQAVYATQTLGADTDIILITGREQAMPNYRSLLRSQGYTVVEEIQSRNAIETNHELALRAPSQNLVVIDDSFGYPAVAVANYANMRNASVIFADDTTVFTVEDKDPEELLLYGHIPALVFDELQAFDPVIINEQDRFESNFALIQRFLEFKDVESVLLTDGDFIEAQLVTDQVPVLFTGRQRVPDKVINLLVDNEFRVGVMVGNALAPNARYIKEQADMSVYIKFSQGAASQLVELDLFPLPEPNPLIRISESEYDSSDGTLRVTYSNPGEAPVYFTASFTTGEGTVEDVQPVFVEAGTYKTVSYDLSSASEEIPYVILYGAYPRTLDLLIQGTINPDAISYDDASELVIGEAYYDTRKEAFAVTVENVGSVDAFVLVELRDVRIGGERVRLGSDVRSVASEDSVEVGIDASLTEEDLRRNQVLEVELFYGEREQSLINRESATLGFESRASSNVLLYVAIGGVIILLLVLLMRRRRR